MGDLLPYEIVTDLLRLGPVYLHIDPSVDQVVIPSGFMGRPKVVLVIGDESTGRDMEITPEGFFGTLTFRGEPYTCFVPWDATFAVYPKQGHGVVWRHLIPEGIEDKPTESEPSDSDSNVTDFWTYKLTGARYPREDHSCKHLPRPFPLKKDLPTKKPTHLKLV